MLSMRKWGVSMECIYDRYIHERIQDVRMIKVVPAKALPRTAAKGNIRFATLAASYSRVLLLTLVNDIKPSVTDISNHRTLTV